MGEPDHTTDWDLMERFRGGDRDAFAQLYRTHYPAVFRFALYMTGDRMRAADITQDVFVWLVHHPSGFDPERGGLAAFLGGVARKFLHREERIGRRWTSLGAEASSVRDRGEAAEFAKGLEREQEAAELRKAIAALPQRYREAVVLCDLQGTSYEQAAEVFGCPSGTVKSRLHRARELLARKFQRSREGQECL
jgi:RNA polymerase sigma factor (sigma-70 family)